MRGLLIYDEAGYERNKWFAGQLIASADKLGCQLDLAIYKGERDFDCSVDFAVVRTIAPEINEYFEAHGIPTFNNSKTSRIANDKWQTYLFAKELGLSVMHTLKPASHENISDELDYPFVLKAIDGHGGSEVFLVDNEQKCKELFTSIGKNRLIIQEFCSESGVDMRVYMLGGEVLAAARRTSTSDFRSNFSLGGNAEIVSVPSAVQRVAKQVCHALGCDLVGIDFIRHRGEWILNEIEDVVGTRMLYSLTSIDAAYEYVKHIVNKINFG